MFKKWWAFRKAKKAIERKQFINAGEIYESYKEYEKAIDAYKKGERYSELGKLYEMLGEKADAIDSYRKGSDYERISKMSLSGEDFDRAVEILENYGQYRNAAQLYYNNIKYEKAAQIFSDNAMYREAANSYEKAGNLKMAAEKLGLWFSDANQVKESWELENTPFISFSDFVNKEISRAVRLYKSVNEASKAEELLRKKGKFKEANELAIEIQQSGYSSSFSDKAGIPKQAVVVPFKSEKFEKPAAIFEKMGLPLETTKRSGQNGKKKDDIIIKTKNVFESNESIEAADSFLKAGDYGQAAELYYKSKDYRKAAYCFQMDKNFLKAAESSMKGGDEEHAVEMYEKAKEWIKAAPIFAKNKNDRKAGEFYERGGDYLKAGLSFLKANSEERALSNFQMVDRNSPDFPKALIEMSLILIKMNMPELVIERVKEFLHDKPIDKSNLDFYYVNAVAYEVAGNFKKAIEMFNAILKQDSKFKDVLKKIKEIEILLINEYRKAALTAYSGDPLKRYKIIDEVGSGDTGIVYKAEDTALDRIVALKILHSDLINEMNVYDRFSSKVSSLMSFSHENLCKYYDSGKISNDYYISMEFLKGENLMEILYREKSLSIHMVRLIVSKLLNALDYIHQKGFIHGNVKPYNIIITHQKEIKVLDFGISLLRNEYMDKVGKNFFITSHYMAPEQIENKKVTHLTDIYSTGVTLFQLITGELPFFKGREVGLSFTKEDILSQHLFEQVPDLKKFRSDLPERLIYIVKRCLAKKEEDRFQNTDELHDEFEKINEPLKKFEVNRIQRIEEEVEKEISEKTMLSEKNIDL